MTSLHLMWRDAKFSPQQERMKNENLDYPISSRFRGLIQRAVFNYHFPLLSNTRYFVLPFPK